VHGAREVARVGIVGCGLIAKEHGRAAREVAGELQIVACADTDIDAARAMAASFGWGAAYADVGEMIAGEQLDGVILATWPNTHSRLITDVLGRGIRVVLCEKPLVLTADEAMEVWTMATAIGASVIEGFMYRHHPGMRRVDSVVRSGSLGQIDHVRASFTYTNDDAGGGQHRFDDPHRPWRLRPDAGGGALNDIGSYAINASTHFAQSLPVRAVAFGRAPNAYGTNDQALGLIQYANGITAIVEASEAADANQDLQLSGKAGTLFLSDTWTPLDEPEIRVTRRVPPEYRDAHAPFRTLTTVYREPRANPFAEQLKHFAGVIRGDISTALPLAESVVNIHIMNALAESLRQGSPRSIDIPRDLAAEFTSRAASFLTHD
jgi:predicted dehydrogenase